jgi:hypothetical protein
MAGLNRLAGMIVTMGIRRMAARVRSLATKKPKPGDVLEQAVESRHEPDGRESECRDAPDVAHCL